MLLNGCHNSKYYAEINSSENLLSIFQVSLLTHHQSHMLLLLY